LLYEQVRNLRIGAMMRTILPALAQAVALNSFSSDECKAENVKEKLQVWFLIFITLMLDNNIFLFFSFFPVCFT